MRVSMGTFDNGLFCLDKRSRIVLIYHRELRLHLFTWRNDMARRRSRDNDPQLPLDSNLRRLPLVKIAKSLDQGEVSEA